MFLDSGIRHIWILILVSPLFYGATLVKLHNNSGPHFPRLEIRVILVLPSRLLMKIKWDNSCKKLNAILAHCKVLERSCYFLLKSINCLPNAYLIAHKILCLNFQAFQKLATAVILPILPCSQQGVYIKSLSPKCPLTVHTLLLPLNFCSCNFLILECLTSFLHSSFIQAPVPFPNF